MEIQLVGHNVYDFNPRTREGCDPYRVKVYLMPQDISIHAPVKGATFFLFPGRSLWLDFNPRTREGCDASSWPYLMASGRFQSTHP